jgi:hypothetical protein
MVLIDPKKIRLLPGQGIEAAYSEGSTQEGEVGLFVRSEFGPFRKNGDVGILQRAGVVHFNDVLLVLTMVRVGGNQDELFDIWWNYHARDGMEHFQRMSEQDRLMLHFCNEEGRAFSMDSGNEFRKFFASLPPLLKKAQPWTDIEFDRAVRGFCAKSYPKENLWDMIQYGVAEEEESDQVPEVDEYPGNIPEDLKPFYIYLPGQGHSINIIPSILEEQAMEGNPGEHLLPAPVKTVLRCGIRWVRGYPVAPIPFIPGHGLAVPPEDTEL